MAKAILILVGAGLFGGFGVVTYQLSEQVESQKAQVERLRNEVQLLHEQKGTPAEGTSPGVAAIPADSFDLIEGELAAEGIESEDLRALVSRMVEDEAVVGAIARRVEGQIEPGGDLFASETFRTGIRDTMEDIRREEREAQMAERAERMEERTENRARDLAERLNLPPNIADQFTEIVVSSQQAMGDVFALARGGEIERGEIRNIMREQRAETNTQLQGLLTEQEYEQYTALSQEMNIFGGGGPGGGRRGRGGNDSGGGNDAAASDAATPPATPEAPPQEPGNGGF